MANYFTKLTPAGRAKVAAAIAGTAPLEITEMALGDGAGNPVPQPTGNETALVREVYRAPLNRLERLPDLEEFVEAEMLVPAEEGGWTVREVGLYDIDGDLIAYGNFPDVYKPTPDEGTAQDLGVRTTIQVSGEADVTLVVDPNIITATRAWVANTIASYLHVPTGGTLGQIIVKTGNADGDYEWQDPTQANVVVNAIPEPQELAENQTVITLAIVSTLGTAFYVDGLRLYPDDYTVDSPTQVTLARSYPAGTPFLAVQNEPNNTLKANQVSLDPNIDNLQTVQALLERLNQGDPAGRIEAFGGTTAPPGWLICMGQEVGRAQYPRLFAAIGTTWGEGNGSTTFNLPDLRDEFLRGAGPAGNVGDKFADSIKSHTHTASTASAGNHSHSGSTSYTGSHQHQSPVRQLGNLAGLRFPYGQSGTSDGYGGHPGFDGNYGVPLTNWSGGHSHSLSINSGGYHAHTVTVNPTGEPETKPRGATVLWCIRV